MGFLSQALQRWQVLAGVGQLVRDRGGVRQDALQQALLWRVYLSAYGQSSGGALDRASDAICAHTHAQPGSGLGL